MKSRNLLYILMKEIKVRWTSILHWPWPLCRLITNCYSNTSRVFKNWKQRACMIFVHQTNDLLEKSRWTKFRGKRSSDFKLAYHLYKLTQVPVICDSCPLSWIECLAISSILSPASCCQEGYSKMTKLANHLHMSS
jgi:hypothetical protein